MNKRAGHISTQPAASNGCRECAQMTLCIQFRVRTESLGCGCSSFDSFRVAFFFGFTTLCYGSMKPNKVTRSTRNDPGIFLMVTVQRCSSQLRTLLAVNVTAAFNSCPSAPVPPLHLVCRRSARPKWQIQQQMSTNQVLTKSGIKTRCWEV